MIGSLIVYIEASYSILNFILTFTIILMFLCWFEELKQKRTILTGIETPEPIDWEIPTDYQSGVYTLTFDHINFFETRNGIYRRYRIESAPLNYPKPEPPKLRIHEQIWEACEQIGKHPFGIHSPSI